MVGDNHHYAMSRKSAEACTVNHTLMSMQPGSQKEMQIDFDDDELPQQTEQGHSTMQDTAKQPRLQVNFTLPLHIANCNANV